MQPVASCLPKCWCPGMGIDDCWISGVFSLKGGSSNLTNFVYVHDLETSIIHLDNGFGCKRVENESCVSLYRYLRCGYSSQGMLKITKHIFSWKNV